jgi:NADH-quinone oxidoreductase E subunit
MNEDKTPEAGKRACLIDALAEVQEKEGYISEDSMRKVQEKLEVPLVEIYGVITFYSEFKLIPSGRHTIKICKGTACHVKKADGLHEHLRDLFDVKPDGTTSDGRFTIEVVNCIGACAKAPAVMIDGEVYGELTCEKLDEVLEQYR